MSSAANPRQPAGEDAADRPPAYWLALALMAAQDARRHSREAGRAAWARDSAGAREAVSAAEDAAAQAATGAAQAARHAPRDAADARAYAAEAATAAQDARGQAGDVL